MNYFKITETKQKTSEILNECKKWFSVYSSFDNDKLDQDFPAPPKITTRYFKKVVEADEELENKSANDLEKEGVIGITLRERLLMELQYFKETGNHLDIDNVTLCSGSRFSDGRVPFVDWGDDRLCVSWSIPAHADGRLRARAAVNLKTSNLISLESRILELEEWVNKAQKVINV